MAAIVRLKRRLSEEPIEALVINCKKPKFDTNSDTEEPEINTVLKFAGTITEQNEDLTKQISKLSKNELEESFKKHIPDLDAKKKKEFLEASKNKRFQVVNLSRVFGDGDHSTKEDKNLAIIDIETENTKQDQSKTNGSENFVYDLYYSSSNSFGDYLDDEKAEKYLKVLPAGAEIDFEDYRNIGVLDDDETSTDDSNDENNWRNDYPDEESVGRSSVSESDMLDAMENMNFGENLSDDDGEEGFVYSIDSETAGFEEDLDQTDVRRYGEMYARFKARQKRVEDSYNRDIYDENDDDDDYYD